MSFLMNHFRFIVAAIVGAAWNILDKSVGVFLSNLNLTASLPSWEDAGGVVRATVARSTGKYYFEVEIEEWGRRIGGSPGIGIARSVTTLATLEGSPFGTGTWIVLSYGTWYIFQNGSYIANGSAWNGSAALDPDVNKVIGFSVDLVAKRMWVRYDHPAFAGVGNPELNQIPHFASITTGDIKPYAYLTHSEQDIDLKDVLTINLGETPFKYKMPIGFQSWDGSQAAPVAPTVPAVVGTIPSAIAGCTSYTNCGDKTSLFANTARTGQCCDGQQITLARHTNSTSNGFSNQADSTWAYFQEDAFVSQGGFRMMSGRLNVNECPGYFATVLTTNAIRALSAYVGTSAGFFLMGLRFNHACKVLYDAGAPLSASYSLLKDDANACALNICRPPGVTGDTHVRVLWIVQSTANGLVFRFVDVPIGSPVVITAGLRSGGLVLRVNGVALSGTVVSGPWYNRDNYFSLLRSFPGDTDDVSLDISTIATYNAAVTDANLLLAEKYMGSRMGLTI